MNHTNIFIQFHGWEALTISTMGNYSNQYGHLKIFSNYKFVYFQRLTQIKFCAFVFVVQALDLD